MCFEVPTHASARCCRGLKPPNHEHSVARGAFVEAGETIMPAPAPRFSRTPSALNRDRAETGAHTDEVLAEIGYSPGEIAGLRASGIVA